MKIFLNPGHGGTDPGVCSKHGIKESDVALAIGLQLFNRLKLNGYPVELYQQKETYFEISKEENKSGATLFISIHCNGVSDPAAHGIEVLYCEGSQKGEKLAEIMQKQLVDITGLEDRGIKARSDLHVLNKTNQTKKQCLRQLRSYLPTQYGKQSKFITKKAYYRPAADFA